MIQKLFLLVVFFNLSGCMFALEKNIPLTLAEQAHAHLYAQSAQVMTERRQAAARRNESAQESIFNSKKGMHRRNPAIYPQSRHSLLTQTGIVVPEQAVVKGPEHSGSGCCPDKVLEE